MGYNFPALKNAKLGNAHFPPKFKYSNSKVLTKVIEFKFCAPTFAVIPKWSEKTGQPQIGMFWRVKKSAEISSYLVMTWHFITAQPLP